MTSFEFKCLNLCPGAVKLSLHVPRVWPLLWWCPSSFREQDRAKDGGSVLREASGRQNSGIVNDRHLTVTCHASLVSRAHHTYVLGCDLHSRWWRIPCHCGVSRRHHPSSPSPPSPPSLDSTQTQSDCWPDPKWDSVSWEVQSSTGTTSSAKIICSARSGPCEEETLQEACLKTRWSTTTLSSGADFDSYNCSAISDKEISLFTHTYTIPRPWTVRSNPPCTCSYCKTHFLQRKTCVSWQAVIIILIIKYYI